ncbi:MAG TPA: alpha/beta fold hydrolase [Beutenbergiaceae bacterium]|nr:alpha/beta fold hydrolase [Beutenbergiaceae bacterium]
MTSTTNSPPTPFHDLDHYVAYPRVSGLTLSPDGSRLVTTVSTVTPEGTGYASALWELDPIGSRQAHRLTRSAKGEAGAAFSASGDLYFTSARPDPDEPDGDPESALWQIPAAGGEARVAASRPGGINAVHCARNADVLVLSADLLPGAEDERAHAALHKVRSEGKVDAILHQGYPVRFWDHDLGPARPNLFLAETSTETGTGADTEAAPAVPGTVDRQPGVTLRNVTAGIGSRLGGAAPALSPDGTFALIEVNTPEARGSRRETLARVDLATGQRRVLLDEPDREFGAAVVAPDGRSAVVVGQDRGTADRAPHPRLYLLDLDSGQLRPLAHDWDRWARPVAWRPDGTEVLALADDDGRGPVFAIDVTTGQVRRITTDDGTYSELVVDPGGEVAYGIRSSYAYPPEVVRIELATGVVTVLPGPVARPELPGRLQDVRTTTDDGVEVRAWLALPEASGPDRPAPLLLWIHGGPLNSWNAWSWRWNPWLLVAQGYAVLLPDPALSTGYGQDFIQRGWGAWGDKPYTDLMDITDAVESRTDIDATRTAAMGGSFGGYMANWVAGHTDRFNAIVTHASLWALDQFGPTTDAAYFWSREMTPQMAEANSPHKFVEQIVTPMLVIHGDKDYRVPIGEGLRLWYELLAHSGRPAAEDGSTVHRFLYFPAENHWVLTPQHAKVWYQVVIAYLAEHVLDQEPELPTTLGLSAPSPEEIAALSGAEEAGRGGPDTVS